MLVWRYNDLYLGKIYIGSIMRVVPEGWRDFKCYQDRAVDDRADYIKENVAKAKKYHERHESKPWRGWLMLTEDGEQVGFWTSKNEAVAALEKLAQEAIKAS